MADKVKYSQKTIDAALEEISDVITALTERDKEIARLIAGLANRIADLEKSIGAIQVPSSKP